MDYTMRLLGVLNHTVLTIETFKKYFQKISHRLVGIAV